MAINITADPIDLILSINGNYTKAPGISRDTTLDQTFDCYGWDRLGYPDQGVLKLTVEMLGTWLSTTIQAEPIEITFTQYGNYDTEFNINSSPIEIIFSIKSFGFVHGSNKRNWIKWSDIGNLDFTINKTNLAGERPLDWKGWIYEIKKLGQNIVVYGQNGVSLLQPVENTFGLKTIYRLGIKGRHAITGTDDIHYFIDVTGALYQLTDKVKKLDYSEYLSKMTNPVMSYDIENQLIYICDGTYGYVYSIDSDSLGSGPINITSYNTQHGDSYVTASTGIDIPAFELCTDIYDFKSRQNKTISKVEYGTDLTESLFASIDFRLNHKENFSNTGWFPVSHEGISYIKCFGKEFRFKLKLLNYEYVELDYIKIHGNVHRYSPLDS